MTKAEIEAFLAVAQYGSISAAAEQAYVTQPALSRRIQNLERELDYALLDRRKGVRGSSLTARGQAFLAVARRWMAVYRDAAALQGRCDRPMFRMAAIGSASRLLLPAIFRGMTEGDVPHCVNHHLCHSVEGYSLIENGSADVVLTDNVKSSAFSVGSVLSTPVYAVPFVVVGGEGWRDVRSVKPAELDPAREISLPWNTAFDIWHARWFDPGARAFAYIDDASAVKFALRDDLFAVMPRTEGLRLARENEGIRVLDLEDGPPDEVIHCLTSAAGNERPAVKLFFEIVRAACEASPGVRCLL
ncbi:MAG: LysR family transcriptional regulator [Mailhella sp.]|nr:LysR family transcriptional regulator [Mailhella sp.]